MSQPEKVTPSYLGPAGEQAPPSLYSVLKEQVMAPQYRDDNLRILRAATIFVAGVAFVRSSWSSTLFPVF